MEMTTSELAGRLELRGQVLDLDEQLYRAHPAISNSGLSLINQNPAKYKHSVLERQAAEPTAAMRLGSAFDCALLTPAVFERTYTVAPEGIRRNSKAWDEFEAGAVGRTIIKSDEHAQVVGMRAAVMRHLVAGQVLSDGNAQVSLFWDDPNTGVQCKGRLDYMRKDGIIIDVKTTGDGGAAPDVFQRTAFSLGYHRQAAFYTDGAALCGLHSPAFMFIVVEREPPYGVALYAMDSEFIELGRQAYRPDLDLYAQCLRESRWPGYTQDIQHLVAPAWALSKTPRGTLYL